MLPNCKACEMMDAAAGTFMQSHPCYSNARSRVAVIFLRLVVEIRRKAIESVQNLVKTDS